MNGDMGKREDEAYVKEKELMTHGAATNSAAGKELEGHLLEPTQRKK